MASRSPARAADYATTGATTGTTTGATLGAAADATADASDAPAGDDARAPPAAHAPAGGTGARG